ncbi:hypothetical protein SISSUDRAFT_1042803 [Sistotremastrum suecicum HHB10207 ss-3]|uniref:Uncharacterized protein n=1 Tax=Sistotremastrum suecicum HHB10207 ss-3 TaxID=1314776 RepID=A0A166G9G0_9AGAM|nr:hypothetical protein SISSUDRAFT_1042803 [Sistotremastrum suecicum HHB10207 ss-3]
MRRERKAVDQSGVQFSDQWQGPAINGRPHGSYYMGMSATIGQILGPGSSKWLEWRTYQFPDPGTWLHGSTCWELSSASLKDSQFPTLHLPENENSEIQQQEWRQGVTTNGYKSKEDSDNPTVSRDPGPWPPCESLDVKICLLLWRHRCLH